MEARAYDHDVVKGDSLCLGGNLLGCLCRARACKLQPKELGALKAVLVQHSRSNLVPEERKERV